MLVVFDCDGTLVDSAALIIACAQEAFRSAGLPPPTDEAVRSVVGLSLHEATQALLPQPDPKLAALLAERYREVFRDMGSRADEDEPLFPGARVVIEELRARGFVLGVATGKTMRGLLRILDHHHLTDQFATLQTADNHPSKPHPAMLEAAMAHCGATANETLMIGDTIFDIVMATRAKATPIGVAWGNHPPDALRQVGASIVLDRFEDLWDHLPAGSDPSR